MIIPGINQTHDTGSGAVKKPVRYGTRIRNKQKKDGHQSGDGDLGKKEEPNMEVDGKPLEEEQEMDPITKGATGLNVLNVVFACTTCITGGGDVTSEDKVPDSWEGEAASSEEVISMIHFVLYVLISCLSFVSASCGGYCHCLA